MKPTIGRIVLFQFEGAPRGIVDAFPAIITNVMSETLVDLVVFGTIEPAYRFSEVNFVKDPSSRQGGWYWPPREGAPT